MDQVQEQLEWEARAGRFAALAAFLSAACLIAGIAARASIGKSSDNKAESLRIAHDHSGDILAFAIFTAAAFGLLAFVLVYLYRATKFRRAELPTVATYIAVLGPILLAISGIIGTLQLTDAADRFVASGAQTEARAKDLTDHAVSPGIGGLGLAGALTTGLAIIIISLNAMRAGLLSRFMGILGIIYGGLQVLPILPGPIIQIFWAGALGIIFLNRWPGEGRGPAWDAGDATPWPSTAERLAAAGGDEPELDERDEEVAEPAGPAEPQSQRNPNARSRKRKKRKARH